MTALRISVLVFVVIVVLSTVGLAILNRDSEKVTTNLLIAVATGAVGSLLTLFFSLQSDKRSTAFPVEYVIDPKTVPSCVMRSQTHWNTPTRAEQPSSARSHYSRRSPTINLLT
jgi:hypothetical protein